MQVGVRWPEERSGFCAERIMPESRAQCPTRLGCRLPGQDCLCWHPAKTCCCFLLCFSGVLNAQAGLIPVVFVPLCFRFSLQNVIKAVFSLKGARKIDESIYVICLGRIAIG